MGGGKSAEKNTNEWMGPYCAQDIYVPWLHCIHHHY